uniref:Uncharacterized protein n=1 Tax=Gadus morhua TaxID=8049 RepID=A0A8C5AZB1_GADMO
QLLLLLLLLVYSTRLPTSLLFFMTWTCGFSLETRGMCQGKTLVRGGHHCPAIYRRPKECTALRHSTVHIPL